MFKPVNEGEQAIIAKSLARVGKKPVKNLKSTYVRQGNFLVVLLMDGKSVQVGVAKRSPRDRDDLSIAVNIALTRASRAEGVK